MINGTYFCPVVFFPNAVNSFVEFDFSFLGGFCLFLRTKVLKSKFGIRFSQEVVSVVGGNISQKKLVSWFLFSK